MRPRLPRRMPPVRAPSLPQPNPGVAEPFTRAAKAIRFPPVPTWLATSILRASPNDLELCADHPRELGA